MIHWLYITIQSRAVRQYSNEDVHNRGFCSDDEQYGLHNSFFSYSFSLSFSLRVSRDF